MVTPVTPVTPVNSLIRIGTPSTTLAAPLNFREVDGHILVTNRAGQFCFLSPAEFTALSDGSLDKTSAIYADLRQKNFIRGEQDLGDLAQRMAIRATFLDSGPHLHILVVTLRCNETCAYCHASRADPGAVHTDMTPETAQKTVELIFRTTSPNVTIEFQGGEPLMNFDVVRHVIEAALKENEGAQKDLQFALVSNLALMDEEKLRFLLEHRVQICTSLDGPAALHNKQRILAGGDAHAETKKWIERINAAYVEAGLEPSLYHVEALLTTTREALAIPEEIIDAYLELGCRALFLRPVDPFGFAAKTRKRLGYSPAAFLKFYRRAVDHMIELNRNGEQLIERFAAIFLTKILTGRDPNYLDIRSPCGAGIGQIAYNYDGAVFTCDEGRMLREMGDNLFQIGNVETATYQQLMDHDVVRSLALASNIDASPDCVTCTYNAYCGLCPVHNYATQGSLTGRMRDNTLCAIYKGIQDYLFGKLRTAAAEDDNELMEIFDRWTTVRERVHFVHGCGINE